MQLKSTVLLSLYGLSSLTSAVFLNFDKQNKVVESNDKFLQLHGKRVETVYSQPKRKGLNKNRKVSNSDKSNSNSTDATHINGTIYTDLDFVKVGFFADVEVGSERDPVKVMIDTGSSDFWIPAVDICYADDDDEDDSGNDDGDDGDNDENGDSNKTSINDGDDGNDGDNGDDGDDEEDDDDEDDDELAYNCTQYGWFDPSNSTSFQSNDTEFLLYYGDGTSAIGEFAQDSVTFNNVTIDNVNLAVANFTNATSGILGIGYPATESTNMDYDLDGGEFQYVNFPFQLANEGIIQKPMYSLYLDEEGDAEILFGAVDHEQYQGKLYKFPIVSMNRTDPNATITRIAITLNSLTINNGKKEYMVGDGYMPVVLDSGTTTVAFPYYIAATIGSLLGLYYDEDLNYFYGECYRAEKMFFKYNFQGAEFMSPVEAYFTEVMKDAYTNEGCIFRIFITEYNYIILGDAFLRDMYTVVDLEDNVAALAYRKNSTEHDIDVVTSDIPSAVQPPNSKTFGYNYHTFEYFGTDISTTAFKTVNPSTLSLNTAFQTVTDTRYLTTAKPTETD